MTWIGIDDTDGPDGGCTTFALTEVIRAAEATGVDLIGDPRLVRLNPNIPWKTRGNAALAARFGHGAGRPRTVGRLPEGPLRSYSRYRPLRSAERERLIEAAWSAVRRCSEPSPGTDPALVAAERALPGRLYWQAVRSVVPIRAIQRLLAEAGASTRTLGSRRGLVGAASAIAWPSRRVTWELIAYRSPLRRSLRREVSADSLRAIEASFPSIFLCTDPRTRRLLVTPHTACPILFGLRSTRRDPLPEALRRVASEPIERWVVYRTNQATGDHLPELEPAELRAYEPARVSGRIAEWPERLQGGHVRFHLVRPTGDRVPCTVFEPTKTLASIARGLAPGDRLEVWGGRGRDPTLRIEGIRILRSPPRLIGRVPPVCPECRRRSSSMGTGKGYRCPGCRRRFPLEASVPRYAEAPFRPGTYHPTPSARRHLHPLAPEPHRRAPHGPL